MLEKTKNKNVSEYTVQAFLDKSANEDFRNEFLKCCELWKKTCGKKTTNNAAVLMFQTLIAKISSTEGWNPRCKSFAAAFSTARCKLVKMKQLDNSYRKLDINTCTTPVNQMYKINTLSCQEIINQESEKLANSMLEKISELAKEKVVQTLNENAPT